MKLLPFIAVILFFCSCQKQETDLLIDARDGHQYNTVKIGSQWWMADNLAYLPSVSKVDDTTGIWVYGYDGKSVNYAKTLDSYVEYACLYSWTYAMDIPEKYHAEIWGGIDSLHQGICPDGWHIPSDSEWQQLEDYLDTNPDFTPSDARQNTGNVGKKIKDTSTWTDAEDNNESGFGAMATGFRYESGHFLNRGKYAYFWSSTEYYAKSALYRYLWDDSEGTFRGYPLKVNGLSIRCVKN